MTCALMFKPLTGPECPNCDCPDSQVVSMREYRGIVWEVRRCDHCAKQYTVESPDYRSNVVPQPLPDKAVIMLVVCCPNCGAEWPPVTSTTKPVRRHKCRECGHTFKSIEKRDRRDDAA